MERSESEQETFNKTTPQPTFLPNKFKGPTERPPVQPRVKDIYPQIVASCFSLLLAIQAGINMAYSAILLPQLMDDGSSFVINTNQASWIASLMAIATPVGTLICGPFMDLLGRRVFSIISTVPVTLSWFLVATTPNSVWVLYFTRILAGIGGGLSTVSLVYISEISHLSWRPMLLCLNSVFVSMGILLTNVLGVYLPWRIVALAAGCLSLVTMGAITLYNPESPYWLLNFRTLSDQHYERAKQSLRYFYPNKQMFTIEWERLVRVSQEKQQQQQGLEKEQCDGLFSKVKHSAHEFIRPSSVLPMTLLLVIFLFQQLSGTYPIIFYAVQVFQSIDGKVGGGIDAYTATILLGVTRFLTSLLTAGLSRSYGRRPLLMFSGIGMTLFGLATAVYFHRSCVFSNVFNKNQTSDSMKFYDKSNCTDLTVNGEEEDFSYTVGLACILLFVTMSSVGVLVIPWTLIGEILPVTIRGTGAGFIFSYAYILMFGIVKVFPFMLDVFQISGLFYFFSFTSFINVLVIYFFLPETLGKNFEEIEKYFTRHRSNSVT